MRCFVQKIAYLVWLGGDWNYVPSREDRWCQETGRYTGTRDAREAALWTSLFQAPGEARLTELDQDEFTWWGASSQSRLDRIYSSHTIED